MAADRTYVAENQAQLTRLETLVNRLSDRDLAQPMDSGWTVSGVLATSMNPSCSLTTPWTMESPRPDPDMSCARFLLKKGSRT